MIWFSRSSERTVSCAKVRELLSAALDGEGPAELPAAAARHLTTCVACREFEDKTAVLTRQLRIRALESIPDLTGEILRRIAEVEPIATPIVVEERRWTAPTTAMTRWALAIVPLGLALSSLASGAFTKPHIVPSRPVTPCTASLAHYHEPVLLAPFFETVR
jgi:predicted anti-sigma-YlaC factor YlaD